MSATAHILDPRTGWPARELASVTVFTQRGIDADALATALFVMGPKKGLAFVESLNDTEALMVLDDGTTRSSEGLEFNKGPPGAGAMTQSPQRQQLKRAALLLIVLALFGNLAFAAYKYVARQLSALIARHNRKCSHHCVMSVSISFSEQVVPILDRRCGNCHGRTADAYHAMEQGTVLANAPPLDRG